MEYKHKGHTVRIEAKQVNASPRIIHLALWICDERIMPVAGSPFEAKSVSSVEDATAYAKVAAEQIIDKRIKDFAPTVGMSPIALEEVLDCIESKNSYKSSADLLRTQFNTPLSTQRWNQIRKWVKDNLI